VSPFGFHADAAEVTRKTAFSSEEPVIRSESEACE